MMTRKDSYKARSSHEGLWNQSDGFGVKTIPELVAGCEPGQKKATRRVGLL